MLIFYFHHFLFVFKTFIFLLYSLSLLNICLVLYVPKYFHVFFLTAVRLNFASYLFFTLLPIFFVTVSYIFE